MTTRDDIAWLARRAGWGLAPGELDELTALGTDGVLDLLVDPGAHGVATEPSPWADIEFVDDQDVRREQGLETLGRWIGHLLTTERPLENAMAWFWHDHFAVSFEVVRYLPSFVGHLELLRARALGDFRTLIREVTTDAAMLVFLDGATSTGEAPNENYGRELLELYTMGIGNYTEADVRAAAVALTGWVVRPRFGWAVQFVPFRHDPTPQTLLGVTGVDDVDGVVDTAVGHPATPAFIAGKVARHLLGSVDDAVVADLAATFADAGRSVAPLVRATLEAGLDAAGSPQVMAPVPWAIQALRATGARPEPRQLVGLFRAMGQVPGNPPNVGGFPGASTWLAASATAARFTAASALARLTPPDSAVLAAAATGAWDELADLLLRPGGFSQPTLDALAELPSSAAPRPGEAALSLALASPDLLIA